MVVHLSDLDLCVDQIIEKVGKTLVIGTPLGLGKANLLLNGIYQRALQDPDLSVTLFTALTLETPPPGRGLEARFMQPLIERWFAGYPELDYATACSRGTLPDNVTVHEFFLSPGKFLSNAGVQQEYISSNYTHVARDMLSRGVNVIVQMVSPGSAHHAGRVSLSCNPDVSLELIPKMRNHQDKVIAVAETNEALPFMYGDAEVSEDFFDLIYSPPRKSYTLFGTPKTPVTETDYMIGLHASALVRDNGTLQVGIGSLGDAVSYALGLRHTENDHYRQLIDRITSAQGAELQQRAGDTAPFTRGLYGATEMFVDGFLHLFDQGVLKRRVYDDVLLQTLINQDIIHDQISDATLDALEQHGGFCYPLTRRSAHYLQRLGVLGGNVIISEHGLQCEDHQQSFDCDRTVMRAFILQRALGFELAGACIMHGGFYLGNEVFYQRLRDLPEAHRQLLNMTSVARINQLYGGETLDRLQRGEARFINSCLMVTLNGTVVSDGLADSRVVSGVGGQYNFVAMAHALDGARSIIKLRSTYQGKEGLRSNIVFNYAHATIPRHLRDIVVTEYGACDLRGRSDAECAQALINIADSRFQDDLLNQVKAHGKVPRSYRIPEFYRRNTPKWVSGVMAREKVNGRFDPFPISCDLTPDERVLGGALKKLAARGSTVTGKAGLLVQAMLRGSPAGKEALLKRLGLNHTRGLREKLLQRMVASELPGFTPYNR